MVEEPQEGRVYSTLVGMIDPETRNRLVPQDAYLVLSSKKGETWTFEVYSRDTQQPSFVTLSQDFVRFLQLERHMNVNQLKAGTRH